MLKKQKYDDIYILIHSWSSKWFESVFGFKRNYITLSHGLAKFQYLSVSIKIIGKLSSCCIQWSNITQIFNVFHFEDFYVIVISTYLNIIFLSEDHLFVLFKCFTYYQFQKYFKYNYMNVLNKIELYSTAA